MNYMTAPGFDEACDAVVAFVAAGTDAAFADAALQAACEAQLGGMLPKVTAGKLVPLQLRMGDRLVPVWLAGFDAASPAPQEALRSLANLISDALSASACVWLDGVERLATDALPLPEAIRQLMAALPFNRYCFDRYLSQKANKPALTVRFRGGEAEQKAAAEGLSIADGVREARDLINDMADSMTPGRMAQEAVRLGAQYGFETEILDEAACRELGMGLFLAVAQGSALPPRLIVMRWHGGPADQAPIGFVGKGITYDSGGLHIKTGSMEAMMYDMNGGGSVIGAMCAIAAQKLPVNVVGVVAACENMVDAKSYRNGDILTAMNGKTVYVRNTDAEGRLSMADAITYCIRKEQPCEIIEVAGLTGAVCNFFGNVCAAALTTDEALYDRVRALTPATGEKLWLMPDFPEYEQMLKWKFADLNNAPDGPCGGITAGMFLRAFHEDTPFLHIDYGAMPFTKKDGANGFGVRTLYEYAKSRS